MEARNVKGDAVLFNLPRVCVCGDYVNKGRIYAAVRELDAADDVGLLSVLQSSLAALLYCVQAWMEDMLQSMDTQCYAVACVWLVTTLCACGASEKQECGKGTDRSCLMSG